MTSNPFTVTEKRGSYFKTKEYMNAIALIVEPKSIERDVPNEFRGEHRTRDEVLADITVFGTEESLTKGDPTEVLNNTIVTPGSLTREMGSAIGAVLLCNIRPAPNGTGYALSHITSGKEFDAAVSYYTGREKATADAAASAPSFD